MHRFRTFPITFSMDEDSMDKLEELAAQRGISRSKCIRALIREAPALLVDSSAEYITQEPASCNSD